MSTFHDNHPDVTGRDYIESTELFVQSCRMREVDLGPGRALLIKEHGEFSAMGHKCPHYGAPLVKGKELLLSHGTVRALHRKLYVHRVLTVDSSSSV